MAQSPVHLTGTAKESVQVWHPQCGPASYGTHSAQPVTPQNGAKAMAKTPMIASEPLITIRRMPSPRLADHSLV